MKNAHREMLSSTAEEEKQSNQEVHVSMPMITEEEGCGQAEVLTSPVTASKVPINPTSLLDNVQLPVAYEQSNKQFDELLNDVALREVIRNEPRVYVTQQERRLASSSLYRTNRKSKVQSKITPSVTESGVAVEAEKTIKENSTAAGGKENNGVKEAEQAINAEGGVAVKKTNEVEGPVAPKKINDIETRTVGEKSEIVGSPAARKKIEEAVTLQEVGVDEIQKDAENTNSTKEATVAKETGGIVHEKEPEEEAAGEKQDVGSAGVLQSRASNNPLLLDLHAPESFEDTLHSRSPNIVKVSATTADAPPWQQPPKSDESHQTHPDSRSPSYRQPYSDSRGWRIPRRPQERTRTESSRRRSRSPERRHLPTSHYSERRRPRSPMEAVSTSRLYELLEFEKEMKRLKQKEGVAKTN